MEKRNFRCESCSSIYQIQWNSLRLAIPFECDDFESEVEPLTCPFCGNDTEGFDDYGDE